MATNNEPNVSTTSLAHQVMTPEWLKMSTVLAGTQAMRGEPSMTPQHEHEAEASYSERVASNVLFNITDLTLRTWVGKPFAASIQYTEDFLPAMKEYTEDINLQGDNLDVFARGWFASGVSHALSHVLVDYPKVHFFPGRTLQDDRDENVRPYAVQIRPEDMIFAESHRINGVETLTHLRIREMLSYRDGWEEVLQEQIKVMDLVTVYEGEDGNLLPDPVTLVQVSIWVYDPDKEDWAIQDQWYMDIDVIPLVTFYSDRTGFMTGKSPLLDLVDLNIRHWQSMSDQIAILTVTRFPMLACSGGDQEDDGSNHLVVGPKEWLFASEPQARFYYVEAKGASIKAGEEDLLRLEERMKSYGAEFMKKSPDRQTASARNLDSSEATSPLQDVVYRFNDALTQVFWLMAHWENKTMVGKAFLPTDFTSPEASTLQALGEAWKEGGLSTEYYLKELQRRSILDENFDFEKNKRQVKAETKEPRQGDSTGTDSVTDED